LILFIFPSRYFPLSLLISSRPSAYRPFVLQYSDFFLFSPLCYFVASVHTPLLSPAPLPRPPLACITVGSVVGDEAFASGPLVWVPKPSPRILQFPVRTPSLFIRAFLGCPALPPGPPPQPPLGGGRAAWSTTSSPRALARPPPPSATAKPVGGLGVPGAWVWARSPLGSHSYLVGFSYSTSYSTSSYISI